MNAGANRDRTIYAFGHVEAWIEGYARDTHQSAQELKCRVGELLQSQGTGTLNSLSSLLGENTGARKPMGTVALDGNAHSNPPKKPGRRLSAKARKAIGKAQRERWAKYHAKKKAAA